MFEGITFAQDGRIGGSKSIVVGKELYFDCSASNIAVSHLTGK